ncbi:MAG: FG-GAP repeat domain-containing protein [Planctomycetota bacterium]
MPVIVDRHRRGRRGGVRAWGAVRPRVPRLLLRFVFLGLGVLGWLALGGCEGGRGGGAGGLSPIASPILEMGALEELSEEVANRLIELSYAVRSRDFQKARSYLSPGFRGTPLGDLGEGIAESLPLGIVRRLHPGARSSLPGAVSVAPFLASLEKRVDRLARIDRVFFKARGAEFEEDRGRGLVRLTIHILGISEERRPISFYGWAGGEVRRGDGGWLLSRLLLERARELERQAPLFTDVAPSAGIAFRGARLGKAGNRNFYWRGAAAGDFDGDGLFDIFTSSSRRNFLYRNRGDGVFEDATESAGLSGVGRVTSPLFIDADNDADQDLFLSRVGWRNDGVPEGDSLALYLNDGEGRFRDATAEFGLELYRSAFSAAAADVNNDGWLDIYLCGYGRLDAGYPNSWYRATNGEPNLLLVNRGGKAFEDGAAASGVAGRSWSYAAAFADFDEDGDQDLYVANDYGDNNLYLNRGDGTFEDGAAALGVLDTGNGMGAAWGDINNDGRLDLYVSNMASSAGNRILRRFLKSDRSRVEGILYKLAAGNSIFRQTGGRFEALPRDAGGTAASWAWGVSLLDIDLDGTQDVYVANGFISGDSLKDT